MTVTVVGIMGNKGSGKGTIANRFVEHGYIELSFANAVKKAVSNIFSWPFELLLGNTEESRIFRETEDLWWSKKLGKRITPRIILQEFATNTMRNNFHQDIWLLTVEREIYDYEKLGQTKFVISDLRFENEHSWIRTFLNNKIISVTRPCNQSYDIHESETSWLSLSRDYELVNDSTIEELNIKVDEII